MTEPEVPVARVKRTRAPRWIWAIPIAAAAVVGGLAIRHLFFGDEKIVVRFAHGEGLQPDAEVRYKGVKVGSVRKVELDEGFGAVKAQLSIDGSLAGALGERTRFWVVVPELSRGLGGLMTGARIEVEPGPGAPRREFEGLDRAPLLKPREPGKSFVLRAAEARSLAAGSSVRYRGVTVGRVQGVVLEGREIAVHIFLPAERADLVRTGTRFWDDRGVTVGTAGEIDVKIPSTDALLGGTIALETPEVLGGPPAPDGARFDLHDSRKTAETAMPGSQAPYVVELPDSVEGLSSGTPVELRGVRVGRVREVKLVHDPATGTVRTPVTIEIDARLLGLEVTPETTFEELRSRLDETMARLVERGLRARLGGGLLPGSASLSLAIVDGAAKATLDVTHAPPLLPAAPAGGIGAALAAVGEEAGPIAKNVRSLAERLDGIAALASRRAGPILDGVERAVRSFEGAVAKVDRTLGPGVMQDRDLSQLIKELGRTAEAVRELASFLTRHPEAFLTGRKGP